MAQARVRGLDGGGVIPGAVLGEIDHTPANYGGEGVTWRVRIVCTDDDVTPEAQGTDDLSAHHQGWWCMAVVSATPVIDGVAYEELTARSQPFPTGYRGDQSVSNPPNKVICGERIGPVIDSARFELWFKGGDVVNAMRARAEQLETTMQWQKQWFDGERKRRKAAAIAERNTP